MTDGAVLGDGDFLARARDLLAAHGAAVALHLRGHGVAGGMLYRLARELMPVAASAGASLFINDRVDIALAVAPTGVVLGRRSIPLECARRLLGSRTRLGYSAHAAEEAASAGEGGADFVVFGHVYATASHPGRRPAGVSRLRDAVAAATVPVVAIGGVTPARVRAVLAAGAHAVAVLSGVWQDPDPVAAAGRYREVLWEKG